MGKYATYEWYYRYRDQSDNYKGVHRLTVAIYDRRGTVSHINNEFVSLYGQRYASYLNGVYDQIRCHFTGEMFDTYQTEWDIEIQRKSSNNIAGHAKYECNIPEWEDDELLFNMPTKFNNQQIDAKKWLYYDLKSGEREWYYVNENLKGTVGWRLIDGQYYYFNDKAIMQTGWLLYNGKYYYLNSSGAMAKGITNTGGNYYCFADSGEMITVTGWHYVSGKWVYIKNTDGILLKSTWEKINGYWYYFDADATMRICWLKYKNKWYYLSDSGKMVVGWQKIGGHSYYFMSEGYAVTGVQRIGAYFYEFDNEGRLIKRLSQNNNDGGVSVEPYSDKGEIVGKTE